MGVWERIRRLFQFEHGSEELLSLGEQALMRGRGAEAESRFRRVLELVPNHKQAREGLLQSWMFQNRVEDVLDFYDGLPSAEQDRYEDLYLLAISIQIKTFKLEAYAAWLQLPKTGPERLAGVRHLSEGFPKCGVLSAHWVEVALQSFALEEADRALKQLRDAQPGVGEERIAHLYAKRDAVQLKESPEISRLLEECAQIPNAQERLRRLEPNANQLMEIAPLQHDTGLALLQAGQPQIAIRYLNRAGVINPYWLNAWINLGKAALEARRAIRARDAFGRVLQLDSSEWVRRLFNQLEESIAQQPELPHLEAGQDKMETFDFSGAADAFRRALTHAPENGYARFLLGKALLCTGAYQKSLENFHKVWSDGDTFAQVTREEQKRLLLQALHGCVTALVEQDELEKAIACLEDAFSSLEGIEERDDLELLKRLHAGELSREVYDAYEAAHMLHEISTEARLAHLDRAIELDESFPQARLLRALLRCEKGEFEEAEKDLMKAMEVMAEPWGILFHLAGVAFLRQDLETAEVIWVQCIGAGVEPWRSLANQNVKALYGKTHTQMTIAAIVGYKRIIEFTPEGATAEAVVEQAPESPAAVEMLGISEEASEASAKTEVSEPAVVQGVGAEEPLFPAPSREGMEAITPEKVRELASEEVPRLSQVKPAGDGPREPTPFDDLIEPPAVDILAETRTSQEEAFSLEFFGSPPPAVDIESEIFNTEKKTDAKDAEASKATIAEVAGVAEETGDEAASKATIAEVAGVSDAVAEDAGIALSKDADAAKASATEAASKATIAEVAGVSDAVAKDAGVGISLSKDAGEAPATGASGPEAPSAQEQAARAQEELSVLDAILDSPLSDPFASSDAKSEAPEASKAEASEASRPEAPEASKASEKEEEKVLPKPSIDPLAEALAGLNEGQEDNFFKGDDLLSFLDDAIGSLDHLEKKD